MNEQVTKCHDLAEMRYAACELGIRFGKLVECLADNLELPFDGGS